MLLREWRQRRRLSQLDLALLADTSARHLSCVETGRARPSRTMVLRLSRALDIPLRERNTLLLAADYAPAYLESSLDDDTMTSIRSALDTTLTAHEPYPAVVVGDRRAAVVGRALPGDVERTPDAVGRGSRRQRAGLARRVGAVWPPGVAVMVIDHKDDRWRKKAC